MTAHTSPMGIEIHATRDEILADYADGSGRYVHYFMPDPTDETRLYLATAYSTEVDDACVMILTRAEHLDGTMSLDDMLTDRFGSTPYVDLDAISGGFEEHIVIDGRSYLGAWANDVAAYTFEYPAAV